MAERESGWTKEFPQVDGTYWLRFADPASQACIVEVVRSVVFQTGVVGDIRNRVVIDECEWLGPISPSDAEQLSELRKAAQNALHWFESRDMGRHAPFVVAELRSVLNPQPKKETQGR